MQHVLHVVQIVLIALATFADRGEVLVNGLGHVLLELAGTAHTNLLGDLDLGAAGADGSRRKQAGHAGAVLGVERDHALGVGLALLDALGRFLGGHRDVDGVAVALAHLAAVQAGQQRGLGQQRVDLGEHLAVAVVKATGDGAGELDVRQLVATNRHHVALAEQDVASLVHRVGEQKAGKLVARCLHLGLDGGVARQLGLGHQRQERQHELVGGGHGGVRVDHGLVGIDTAGKVVHDHVVHVVLDVLGGVAVGDDLVVGDEHVGLGAHVLQLHAALESAKVVTQVQASGGAVAGKHGELFGRLGQALANGVAFLQRDFVAVLVWHDCS